MIGFLSGSGRWVVVAIALVVLAAFVVRTVSAIRTIARRPAASSRALWLHDGAAGSLGRVVAVAAYLVAAIAPSLWGARWDSVGWPLAVAGAVTVLALIVMERRWPVPGGTVRSAALQRRSLVDVLPRSGVVVAGAGVLVALGVTVGCALIGVSSPGPAPAGTSAAVSPAVSIAPWPDWRWTAPLWAGLLVTAALTAVAIALLLRRPALAGFDRAADLTYRRAGADRLLRVLSCYGWLVASTVMGAVAGAAEDSGDHRVALVLECQVAALFLAAFLSVDVLRIRPPKKRLLAVAGPAAPEPTAQ